MPSLFERAFLQAARRHDTHHPSRLKYAIRPFHQVCVCRYPKGLLPPPNENDSLSKKGLRKRNKPDDYPMEEYVPLMKGGFGKLVECMFNLSHEKLT
jgi:hypothetical protein